jgi:integrase
MPMVINAGRDLVTREEAIALVEKADSSETKALVSILYLSGARISEVMTLRRKDCWTDEKYLWIRFKTLKDRKTKVIVSERHNFFELPTPEKENFFVKKIIEFVTESFSDMDKDIGKDKLIFFSDLDNSESRRNRAWRLLKKLDETLWAHLFRHTRATSLANKGATEARMMGWFGWTDPRATTTYIKRSIKTIEGMGELIE